MREYWVNVYYKDGYNGKECDLGNFYRSRQAANVYAGSNIKFRIHVKLKPGY